MAESLINKVTVITGASSGLGADTAKLFAKKGAIVVLAARRVERLNALAEEIRAAGGKALVVPLDVTDLNQINAAVKTVLDKYGRIDILVNNAGQGRLDWLETLDPTADINLQIDINLRGVVQMTRAVLPSMLARRKGHIINMSSIAGIIPAPMYTIYAATKFGVRGFTNALRRDTSPFGIKVSGIYPGPATTEFSQHAGDNPLRRNVKLPGWINMTSEYVARRTVGVARHPRRSLVIPWWFRPLVVIDTLFPGMVDWLVKVVFVKRFHHLNTD